MLFHVLVLFPFVFSIMCTVMLFPTCLLSTLTSTDMTIPWQVKSTSGRWAVENCPACIRMLQSVIRERKIFATSYLTQSVWNPNYYNCTSLFTASKLEKYLDQVWSITVHPQHYSLHLLLCQFKWYLAVSEWPDVAWILHDYPSLALLHL